MMTCPGSSSALHTDVTVVPCLLCTYLLSLLSEPPYEAMGMKGSVLGFQFLLSLDSMSY